MNWYSGDCTYTYTMNKTGDSSWSVPLLPHVFFIPKIYDRRFSLYLWFCNNIIPLYVKNGIRFQCYALKHILVNHNIDSAFLFYFWWQLWIRYFWKNYCWKCYEVQFIKRYDKYIAYSAYPYGNIIIYNKFVFCFYLLMNKQNCIVAKYII